MAVGELYITMLRSEFRPLIRGWTYKRSDALIEIGVRGRGALAWPPSAILDDDSADAIAAAVLMAATSAE
jgi:hypothetical protein